jgi:cholest-4-en-3-one 26-monooxygenase
MWAYANELAEAKRQQLADDIVSKLISPDEAGNQLSEFEFDMFFMLLAVAGNETTRNAISGGMLALIEHPQEWDKLRSDLSLVPSAADEIVRWVTPVNMFRRTPKQDVEIGGVPIKKGEKVVIYYTSANRDETVFTDPEVFDIAREPNPHVGFGGGGPHFCLGRHLAKLELECIFRSLAVKCERVELVAQPRRLRSNFINGIKEMTVRFHPAAGA